jgi:hypothetical protein
MSRPASWLILSCMLVAGCAAMAAPAAAQERPLNLSIPKEALGGGISAPPRRNGLPWITPGGGGSASAQAGEARGGGMPFGAGYEARRGIGGGLGGPMGGAGRGRR